MNDDVKDR